jgi:serine protease SohB
MSILNRLPVLARVRMRRAPVIPFLRLSGVIGVGGLRGGLTLASLERTIDQLFRFKAAPAVAIVINSPGGSPAQSSLIAGRIRALAGEKKKPVLGFVEDVAASGGYWLACAADEIIVDANSILGSIGVVSSGFGFTEAIAKLGIERRLHTSGERKSLLDPFRPERAEDLAFLTGIQTHIHARFIDYVKERRGARLQPDNGEMFDGRIFLGEQAVAAGLVDAIGDIRSTIKARFGPKARLLPIAQRRSWLQRRLRPGAEAGHILRSALDALDERALWQRYGL